MDGERILHVADALVGPDYAPGGPMRIAVRAGRIASLAPADPPGAGPRLLAMPAPVDAHNHGRPLSTTSFGCGLRPLESWLPRLAVTPPADPYLGAAAFFARSARGGAAGVMVHLTRQIGATKLADEAVLIARAARDIGVSIGFAVSMRDRNPLVYGGHAELLAGLPEDARAVVERTWLAPMPPVDEQLARVEEVADALAGFDHVDLQYGPNGVQWCSDALLGGIAEASARSGRRVHMHLLETPPQRQWADRNFAGGIVGHLEDIGLLSPRLTLAHCVWARPDELERIAAAGARIAVNPSSNLHLASGIAPVAAMKRAGVAFAMGLDGCAFDEDDDALREMRLFRHLNGGWGYDRQLSPAEVLHAVCAAGRPSLGMEPGGTIAEGQPADLLLLDLDALDRDGLDRDGLTEVDPRHYIFTRAAQAHIVELVARGRTIVENGAVAGIDLAAAEDELRRHYRAAMPERSDVAAAFDGLEPGIAEHYRAMAGVLLMARRAELHRLPMAGPGDTSAIRDLIASGAIEPAAIVAILGKTEGNGCVNDHTRGYAVQSLRLMLDEHLDRQAVERICMVMSGGTEGGLSPHWIVLQAADVPDTPDGMALAVGCRVTRALAPAEIGRMAQVRLVADGVREAMREAAISGAGDVHFVQIKCPLLTAGRVAEAGGPECVATADTLKSMGLSRGASALGVALALGEVDEAALSDGVIGADMSLFSARASTSAGVELMACEIVVLGMSEAWAGPLRVGHAVMRDAIDVEPVRALLDRLGADGDRVAALLAKAEASRTGLLRGRRHTMLDDSDISATRHARGFVGGALAGVIGHGELFVSGGAEHQGPDGGGPCAIICRR